MPHRIWRIVKTKHADTAFDGEGARLFGGRWNQPGSALVYCSETLSLAAMEIFVHIDRWELAFKLVAIAVDIPETIKITHYTQKQIDKQLKNKAAQDVGTDWVNKADSVALCLPSALVSHENNYLINPNHPDFKKLTIHKPETFEFDQRMWK